MILLTTKVPETRGLTPRPSRPLRSAPALLLLNGLILLAAGCAGEKRFQPLEKVDYTLEEWRFGRTRGRLVRTEHYEIYTTVRDDELARALPQAMETAYAYFRFLLPGAGEPAARMQVYLFGTRAEFERFTRGMFPEKAEKLLKVRSGGYCEGGKTVIEYVAHEVTFPLMTHEGFHQFVHHCVNQRIPAWLDEGLAVWCEGQRWGQVGLKEFDPWHNPVRLNDLTEAIQREQTFPLRELLRINAGHVIGGPTSRVGAYYGQLLALMLFLKDGPRDRDGQPKYAAQFGRLLESVGTRDLETYAQAAFVSSDRPEYHFGEALFRSFITDDLERFEAEFNEFCRSQIVAQR